MSRVRRGFKSRRRRNQIRKLAKGFHFSRRQKYKHAVETVTRALHYSYISRRLLKRTQRRLWISRITAGAQTLGSSYSKFMGNLQKKGCLLNRKMLAEIAARDFESFKVIFETTNKS